MPKAPKKPSKTKAFDVAALLKSRAESVLRHIQIVRATISATANKNLHVPNVVDAGITVFGTDFNVDLQTTSRFIADRVNDAMNAVPGRHYAFQLDRKEDNWFLTCMRLDAPAKGRKKGFAGPGFDLEDTFVELARAAEKQLEPHVQELLAFVTNEALEHMPDGDKSFDIEVESTIAVAKLALKRLQRAQRSGWHVELVKVYDSSQTFDFIAPRAV